MRGGDSDIVSEGGTAPLAFTATVVPTELGLPPADGSIPTASPLYLLEPKSDLISTTNLSVTYLDNTKIVSKIGSSVTDNISTTLKDVTAIAVAAASFAGPPSAASELKWQNVGVTVVTVAANGVVDVIPIPKNGNIVMNSICGASTTSTASTSGTDQAAQDLAAAMADAQQVYKAWKSQ